MNKIRYFIRLTIAYLSRFKGIISLGIFIGIIIFFVFIFLSSYFVKGKTERIGIVGHYHSDNLPDNVLGLISRGLTRINEGGIVEPDIAQTWETPDKGKTWIFHLKNDLYWQDETKLTSQSLVYEFSDVEIEKPDDYTIIFKLNDYYSPFPSVVSKPTFSKGLLGVNEWKVVNVSVAGSFVQEITIVNEKKDKKIYKFYPTVERTKLAYKLGEVDIIEKMLDPKPFDSWKNTNISKVPDEEQVVTMFINEKDPILSEKSIRQSMAYAINKNYFESRAVSPISPNSWAYNPQVKPYNYDPDRAKELLEDLPKEAKENLQIKLVSTSFLLPIAENIAKDWNEVGIKTMVQVSSIIPSDFQVYLTILDIPRDPDQYPLWHSTQSSTNISNYTNPRIDKLLEDGRTELDITERKNLYIDFQRFLIEDLPAIFLFHPVYYTVSRK